MRFLWILTDSFSKLRPTSLRQVDGRLFADASVSTGDDNGFTI